jgi:hypothetical protein
VQANGADVHLFAPKVGEEVNCVHFPYLVGIAAELEAEVNRVSIPIMVAIIGLVISTVLAQAALLFHR